VVPLYFIYSGPPPAWNVLTRDLIALVSLGSMLVFIACLSHLIRRTDVTLDWLTSIVYGAGMLYVTEFYSAHGWGNSAFVGGFLGYWILAVGIASLAKRPVPEQG
jgi:hypothetical protein